MKHLFLFLTCIAISNLAHGQKNDSATIVPNDKMQLLSKARLQKTIGWTIFGTGVPVVLVTGYLLTSINKNDIDKPLLTTVFVAGIAYTLVSIPLIKAGNRNKRKAITVGLTEHAIMMPALYSVAYRSQPAISLRITL